MGFITIIPIEETFLRVFDKPPKVRLSRQVIEFNYAHLSPYRNGGHIACQTGKSIYVWYLKDPLAQENRITIPKSYLVWRFFRDRKAAIIHIPHSTAQSLLLLQNGELRAQITLPAGEEPEQRIDLLKREYSLQDAEIIRLEPAAQFSPKPADILAFATFDLKPTVLLEKMVALLKAPLIAVLVITAGFTIYQSTRMESLHEQKKRRLTLLKRENASLQTSLEQVRDKSAYWRDFIAKEQAYPDFYLILSSLTSVVQKHGGYLNMVEFNDNRLTVWTGLKTSEAAIIKDFLATGIFQEVKLLSSTKDFNKPDFNLYNLAITLRQLQLGKTS